MTEIDLTTLEAGDTVKFRCGGTVEVTSIFIADIIIEVGFVDVFENVLYYSDGAFSANTKTPFDIVEIQKKPFDWSEVEAGTAFKVGGTGETLWYIGPDITDEDWVIMTDDIECTASSDLRMATKSSLEPHGG